MSKLKDLTGKKFGRLTVLYRLYNYHKRDSVYWICMCDCGNLVEVSGANLKKNNTKSCGCFQKETAAKRFTKHNKSNTRLYKTYNEMKSRCYNKNDKDYQYYGGRGIAVCDEWLDDFMNFYNWAMDNDYLDDLTIDRIDVDSDYSPDNCRWVDMKTQNRNTRRNRMIVINGETHCLSEWCEILNLDYNKINSRINTLGWSIKKALELED